MLQALTAASLLQCEYTEYFLPGIIFVIMRRASKKKAILSVSPC